MAVDVEAGIIYVPTGSAAPDFYGGNRLGSNLYSLTPFWPWTAIPENGFGIFS